MIFDIKEEEDGQRSDEMGDAHMENVGVIQVWWDSNGKWHRYLFACKKSYSYHWWFIRVGLDVPFFQPRLQVGKCQSHFVDYISRFVGHILIFVDHILIFVDHILIFVDHKMIFAVNTLMFVDQTLIFVKFVRRVEELWFNIWLQGRLFQWSYSHHLTICFMIILPVIIWSYDLIWPLGIYMTIAL